MIEEVEYYDDGLVICGTFPDKEVLDIIRDGINEFVPLVIADPPYGNIVENDWDQTDGDDIKFCDWMVDWTKKLQEFLYSGAALYVWGGVGKPHFRPFYRYLIALEEETKFTLSNHITWSKKRAYGVQHNYLFTREELAYFVYKNDIKEPKLFNVPLLDSKRGYAGYNEKYPAKSEFFRRTNVWMDITEIFKGKTHIAQKPVRLMEIPIEIHTEKRDWVIDPFAGSGTTAHAARKLGRKFVLVEKDKGNWEKIVASLKG